MIKKYDQGQNITNSLIAQPDTMDISAQFAAGQNKNEMTEVLKELFDEGKIFMITHVSRDEAVLMTRIYMVAKMKNIDIWLRGIEFYSKILLSVDRKSRKELINAIVSSMSGMQQRMNPFNMFSMKR